MKKLRLNYFTEGHTVKGKELKQMQVCLIPEATLTTTLYSPSIMGSNVENYNLCIDCLIQVTCASYSTEWCVSHYIELPKDINL